MSETRVLGGSMWILPVATIGWALTAAMVGGILPLPVLLRMAGFAALALLFTAKLRHGEYSFLISCAITALTLLQPAMLWSIGGPSHGIWLAGGIYAIAASAQTFARREDARSVMQLGGSLAALQILDPLGGLVVAALLPGFFGLNRKEMKMAHSAGLFALVLFMPVITAMTLAYLSSAQHLNIPEIVLGISRGSSVSNIATTKFSSRVVACFAPLLIVAPVVLWNLFVDRHWSRPTMSTVLIACAIALAGLIATLSGTVRNPFALTAASASLPLLAIAEWPRSQTRVRDSIAVATATAALAWILAL